jgi:hypothetical protein
MTIDEFVAERLKRIAEFDRRSELSRTAFRAGSQVFQNYFLGQCNASINRIRERAERAEEHYRQLRDQIRTDASGPDARADR